MTDKNLTDNEIKKALECCVSEKYTCGNCPYQEIKHYNADEGFEIMPNGRPYDDWSCERWLNVDLLDLINRLQEEKEVLEARIGVYETCNARKDEAIKHLESEVKRLQAENEDIKFLYENLKEEHLEIIKAIKHTKSEAYKEFAERLKENSIATFSFKGVVMVEEIDNLLKEMAGEDNESKNKQQPT